MQIKSASNCHCIRTVSKFIYTNHFKVFLTTKSFSPVQFSAHWEITKKNHQKKKKLLKRLTMVKEGIEGARI